MTTQTEAGEASATSQQMTQEVQGQPSGAPDTTGADGAAAPAAAATTETGTEAGQQAADPEAERPTPWASREDIYAKARRVRQAAVDADPEAMAAHRQLTGEVAPPSLQQQLEAEVNGGAAPATPTAAATTTTTDEKPLALNGETRTIRVDGADVVVPVDRIIEAGTRALQKDTSADLRLRQAAATLAEAERIRNEALAAAGRPSSPDAAPAATTTTHLPATGAGASDEAAVLQQAQDALFEDGPERAAQLLRQQRERDAAALRRQTITETNAVFARDFDDVASNPEFMALAAKEMRAELAKNPSTAEIPVIAARVGASIRNQMLLATPLPATTTTTTAAPATTTVQSRTVVKARLPVMPAAASVRVPDSRKPEPSALSRAQIVQQMKIARGQAPRQ